MIIFCYKCQLVTKQNISFLQSFANINAKTHISNSKFKREKLKLMAIKTPF